MFCDLVGSTLLAEQLEPEDWSAVLMRFRQACKGMAEQFGGYVAQHLGDGALVYFGYPRAGEDDAIRAGSAALDLIDVLAQTAQRPLLSVRIGIATGRVLVGQDHAGGALHEGGAVGSTPNRAQRLQALARPGEVIIDQPTYRLIKHQFQITGLGSVDLKGFDEPVACHRIDAVFATEQQKNLRPEARSPLVGRLGQIEQLLSAWRSSQSGEGRVALITGEPGIGKTRLVSEFIHSLGPDITLISASCSALASASPLQPFAGAFERILELDGFGDIKRRQERLSSSPLLAGLPSGQKDALYEFLGARQRRDIEGAEVASGRKEQLLSALQELLARLGRAQPLVLILEDLHWSDPTTLELLGRIVASIEERSLLVLATARPEYQTSWSGAACVETLIVNRLGRKQSAALARDLASGQLDESTIEGIVERSDGVPLFVEELTASALESQVRSGDAGVRHLNLSPIPATLDASLASRLDRLGAARIVARIASVIGRSFEREALQALWDGTPAELDDALRALLASGLVVQTAFNPDQFAFKHALIEDAAYAALPRPEAQALHGRLVAFWQDHKPRLVYDRPDVLAYHATRSGQAELGAHFASLAGAWALARYANIEAIAHFQQALEHLKHEGPCPERDRREHAILMMLGPAMRATKGHADTGTLGVYQRARHLGAQVGTVRERMNVLYGVWGVHYARAEHSEALDWAREAFAVGEASGDVELQILGTRLLGESLWAIGELDEACRLLEAAIALVPEEHDITDLRFSQDHRVAAGTFLAWALAQAGHVERAHQAADAAMKRAELLDHPLTTALSKLCGAYLSLLLRDAPAAFRYGCDGVAICDNHAISNFSAWAKFCREWGAYWLSSDEVHVVGMRAALADAERLSAVLFRPLNLAMLGEVECHRGAQDVARSLFDEAIMLVQHTGERAGEAEVWRLSALCHRLAADPAAANTDLDRADEAARRTGARLYALWLAEGASLPSDLSGHATGAT